MFSFVKTTTQKNPITESYLNDLESQYGIEFPMILRQFFLQHNGQQIQPITLLIGNKTYEVRKIVQIKDPRLSMEQLLHAQRLQNYPVRQMIPIADDRANGMYYYHTGQDIVYFSELSGDDDFQPICYGLDTFFVILDEAYGYKGNTPYDITKLARRVEMMAKFDFLPLGSIVLLKGGTRKVMIIARGLNVKRDDDTYFFDYGGVLYPDGLTGDQMVYFDHDGIVKVYFHGYTDDADDGVLTALNEYIDSHPNINRADPSKWNPGFNNQ